MDDARLFRMIFVRAKRELNSKLRVAPKSQIGVHKLINCLLNVVYPKDKRNAYLEDYTTTLGYTIAMAQHYGDDVTAITNWRTLCHEIQHAEDARRWTRPLFAFLYLWPLSQGALLLLVGWLPALWFSFPWNIVYLLGLAAIALAHFIPDLPDPWRKRWEMRAYGISMYLYHMVHRDIPDRYISRIANNFASMMYYVMDPRLQRVRLELEQLAGRIKAGKASDIEHLPIVQIARREYEAEKQR